MEKFEVVVPNIGKSDNLLVTDILVEIGSQVVIETPLIVLESDKTSIEIPSQRAGTVTSIHVNIGDKISEGDSIITLELSNTTNFNINKSFSHDEIYCEMLVLGAGPGGYSAAFLASDFGMQTVIVERHAKLGGVCLNVGCIPSKFFLNAAELIKEIQYLSNIGIEYGSPNFFLEKLRNSKNNVIELLANGLSNSTNQRGIKVIRGIGSFIDKNHIEITNQDNNERQVVSFQQAIIATGSHTKKLPISTKRIMYSSTALDLENIPNRMLIIGGGIIGLELATIYSSLGTQVHIVEQTSQILPGIDRDLVAIWSKVNTNLAQNIILDTTVSSVKEQSNCLSVNLLGKTVTNLLECDSILVAIGRNPNSFDIGIENTGILTSENGFIKVDKQMRTNIPNIFAIGDVVGLPMLAHKALYEANIAVEAATGKKTEFDAKQIPSVAYTYPEIAWAGKTEEQCKALGIVYQKALVPWKLLGRAVANMCEYGLTKLLFDKNTHQIIGGGVVGKNASDIIGEICLALEMCCDNVDITQTIHPHPTFCESVNLAASFNYMN